MSNASEPPLIETREYRRFAEFCDACRRYRYIGLCYGPPGVGKTLSARHYANWGRVAAFELYADKPPEDLESFRICDVLFYTPGVVNSPGQVQRDLHRLRHRLHQFCCEPLRWEEAAQLEQARQRQAEA